MMDGFEPVTFTWAGESYTVQPENQLLLIAKIEADLTAVDRTKTGVEVLLHNPPQSLLAKAYETALRHAGANIKHGEVYMAIMRDFASGKSDAAEKVQTVILALLQLIAPPIAEKIFAVEPGGDDEKKPEPAE